MTESADRWLKAETIFHEALGLSEPERTVVLESRCNGDTALMEELRALLLACEAEQVHQHAATTRDEFPSARVGAYRIDRLLGRGGMGAVYLAHRDDGQFEQQVAIKIVDMPLVTELFRERFRSERQILASLSHPYIARLLDGGVSDTGELYLAMEYIEGVSITQFCDEHTLSVTARLQLFRSVCQAVQCAHQSLVVHRDLKPDNILVVADGTPRLLDFGTAKILTPAGPDSELDLTRQGVQTFTPRYASPEQVLGRPITVASDTYSLGVLLFALLTGEHPYELKEFSTEEMVRVICHQPPRRPSEVMPSLDADLDSIVLKALRKEPQERYTTTEQLSLDVEAYLQNRPVGARRGSLRYRAGKFAQRNKLALVAASLLCLTLLLGIGGVLWQSREANLQRRRAEARSADLRELSNSLLSELDEALKDIPGSTSAQKLLVTRVLEHLDRMARDTRGDRQTELDLIEAYTRLGNVQGNIYYQNVADTSGAVTSFNKALALAAPLAAASPKDMDVLRAQAAALEARGEALSQVGDAQASASSLQDAVGVYDRVIRLPNVTPALIFEAAIATETLGNEMAEDSGLADAASGVDAYHHALDMDMLALKLDPNYVAVRRGIPVMHLHIGNAKLDTDPAEALNEFRYALQLEDVLPSEEKRKMHQVVMRALLTGKEAEAYVELGQYAKAWPLFGDARQVFQQLADADKNDAAAKGYLARLLANEALAREYAADPVLAENPADRRLHLQAAAGILQHLAEVLKQLLIQSPAQQPWVSQLASTKIQLNAVHHALKLPGEDDAGTSAALHNLLTFAESPRATANDIDLAVRASLQVQPVRLRDHTRTAHLAEQGVILTHRRSPNYLLLLAQACLAAGDKAQSESVAREGLSHFERIRGSEKIRLRKLLWSAWLGRPSDC
jgi:eukaryotic-like serine/threonine-protein kinase